ncbi:hypothetical protein ZWY2020_006373, partial [Hordeum vulgare]
FNYHFLSRLAHCEGSFTLACPNGKKNYRGYHPIILQQSHFKIHDCFGRPIASAPDAWFDVVEHQSNDDNKTLKYCLNLGSYNYLGFAAAHEYCTPHVIESLKKYFASNCSARVDGPAAIHFGMGYVTNFATIPILIGKGGMIVRDSLNQISIVNGAKGSGATVRVFQHNNVLREEITGGQPRTHIVGFIICCVTLPSWAGPWKKVIVIVEGICSMEGELCNLPEIMAVCKKYKAHSIGAVGKTGRGVCELLGVDPADMDIMMGTFTKSFRSYGGYIAASKILSKHASMVTTQVEQVLKAQNDLLNELNDNSGGTPKKLGDPGVPTIPCSIKGNYVRTALCDLGAGVSVMPLSLYRRLELDKLTPTEMSLQMADKSTTFPIGICEDVPIHAVGVAFPYNPHYDFGYRPDQPWVEIIKYFLIEISIY